MKFVVVSMEVAVGLMVAGSAMAVDMPELAKKNNCIACHAIDKNGIGPAWMEVSKKYKGVAQYTYKGKEYALGEGLMLTVSKGGKGNWGSMPMPANDATDIKQPDIKKLVEFVLSLAK